MSEPAAYPFCPGCSHGLVDDALKRALAGLGAPPEKIALVTDIGCVGLADPYFKTHTFHGLHGRAVTYAAGLKLARPDLTVVALIGDGACGIGGHHLIAAARRNIGITVVVYNNFNYGMTGGEHSPTTPSLGRTSDAPLGSGEAPMDICALMLAASAPFVARANALETGVDAVLGRALRHPGFALVDVWELCTAYYAPANRLSRAGLREMSLAQGMPFGVLRDAPRPELSLSLRQAAPAPATAPARSGGAPPRFTHELAPGTRLEIVVAGSAGQKVRSAAAALAAGAMQSGLQVSQRDEYPITVKTGHSVSELVISDRPIRFTGIRRPDALVILSIDGLRWAEEAAAAMDERGWVYLAGGLPAPATRAQVLNLALGHTGLPRTAWALAALARLLTARAWFPIEALRAAAGARLDPLTAEEAIDVSAAL